MASLIQANQPIKYFHIFINLQVKFYENTAARQGEILLMGLSLRGAAIDASSKAIDVAQKNNSQLLQSLSLCKIADTLESYAKYPIVDSETCDGESVLGIINVLI